CAIITSALIYYVRVCVSDSMYMVSLICRAPLSSVYIYFFFLMIRQPPRSTLFPSRRSSDLKSLGTLHHICLEVPDIEKAKADLRSEEHTSELQSPCNLVCRLLLEKKKKHPKLTRLLQNSTH